MSIYVPKVRDLRAEQAVDGWWVCDPFGRIDGPYASQRDATSTFENEATERAPGWPR